MFAMCSTRGGKACKFLVYRKHKREEKIWEIVQIRSLYYSFVCYLTTLSITNIIWRRLWMN